MNKANLLASLRDARVIAVLRAESSRDLVAICDALSMGGVKFMEITLTTPGALEIIAEASAHLKRADVAVGAGTVLDAAAADAAVRAGARFVVSPGYDADVVRACNEQDIAVMPGALTATEVIRAWRGGADAVKVFPADLGGPEYIKALKEPLPQVELIPTKGIDFTTAEGFLRAGALAVGAGSALASHAQIAARDYAAIAENARRFVRLAQGTSAAR